MTIYRIPYSSDKNVPAQHFMARHYHSIQRICLTDDTLRALIRKYRKSFPQYKETKDGRTAQRTDD